MSADVSVGRRSMTVRLALAIVGALLMVVPPYAFEVMDLSSRFQITVLAALELLSLVIGFVLLFLAFRGQKSTG